MLKGYCNCFLLMVFLGYFCCFAKDSTWHYTIDGSFIITFNTFSDNWTGTNAGSLIWVSRMNGLGKRQLTDKILSENTLKLLFGQTRVQDKKSRKWSSPEKSSDEIDIMSILKFRFGGFIDPFVSVRLNSQFLDNRIDSNIAYLNPFELSESFGIARDILNTGNFFWNFRFGSALRHHIDLNRFYPGDSNKPGFTRIEIVNDGGMELFSEFRFRRGNLLRFSTRFRLFQAMISTVRTKSSLNNYWRHPDANLESTLNMNVTKNILFNYYINVIYDRETGSNPRIKQTMGAGLGFWFSSKAKK